MNVHRVKSMAIFLIIFVLLYLSRSIVDNIFQSLGSSTWVPAGNCFFIFISCSLKIFLGSIRFLTEVCKPYHNNIECFTFLKLNLIHRDIYRLLNLFLLLIFFFYFVRVSFSRKCPIELRYFSFGTLVCFSHSFRVACRHEKIG
jgi:uncharacterized membrane protein